MTLLLRVHDLDPSILRPGRFIAARGGRALFAIADRRELGIRRALQQQCATHGLRTALAEADVVLARAALVRVPFEAHLRARYRGEMLRVSRDDVRALAANLAAIEVEVNGAFREQSGLRARHIVVF